MRITTLQGIVENGQTRLTEDVRLPEKTTVNVVVPGVEVDSEVHLGSPRLAHPEQAEDFTKEVVPEVQDAGV